MSTIATGTFRSLSCKDSGLYGTSASVPTAAILASEPDQQPSAHVALPLSPFSVLVPSGTLPGAARLPPHPASLFDVWCLGFGVTCLVCLVGCALVWFGGDVLAVPVPVASHPPPLSVAVVQIEVNGASSLSPSLPLVCSSRFYVSRVVIVLPTEMTIGVVLYTYLSFVYLNTCLGCGSEYDSYRDVEIPKRWYVSQTGGRIYSDPIGAPIPYLQYIMITFGVTTPREWVYVRQLDPRLWPFKPVSKPG